MLSDCSAGEDSSESLGHRGDQTNESEGKSPLNIHWKDWCWSWSSNILATWCEELTHLKRPWCWERLRAKGEEGSIVEMVRSHHRLNGHEFGQTLGDSGGQRSLACHSARGHKDSDTTQPLNNNTLTLLCGKSSELFHLANLKLYTH